MKLMRYGHPGFEKPACIDAQGRIRDLSDVMENIHPGTLHPNIPGEPILFTKWSHPTGPDDIVVLPPSSQKTDWEVERGGNWDKGKGCDTFGPVGPWLVTTDEIPDPQNLSMWLEVNGHRYQQGHTSDMIFDVAYLVHYISQFVTLHPGDLITTGTPAGVGLGQKPPVYLKHGDVMNLGIENLGQQTQHVRNWDASLLPPESSR